MEQDEKPRPPEVVYANIVSLNITTDDMLLEFWAQRRLVRNKHGAQ